MTLHDLVKDPGELENLGHPDHPAHDPKLVERMVRKLHVLVRDEMGDDRAPFDLDLFGTREGTRGALRHTGRTKADEDQGK